MNYRLESWFWGDLELNIRRKNTGCDVATSQRRDTWSTEESQQSDPTSQRHHDFCTTIIKSKGRPNFKGIEERADWEAKNRAVVTWIIGEDTSFCIFLFSDKLRMIVKLMMFISSSSIF